VDKRRKTTQMLSHLQTLTVMEWAWAKAKAKITLLIKLSTKNNLKGSRITRVTKRSRKMRSKNPRTKVMMKKRTTTSK